MHVRHTREAFSIEHDFYFFFNKYIRLLNRLPVEDSWLDTHLPPLPPETPLK